MKLIKPSYEIWDQEIGLEGIYKQIEKAARVCYASKPKAKELVENISSKDFVDKLIKLGHTSMLEHATVYLSTEFGFGNAEVLRGNTLKNKYEKNPYSKSIFYGTKMYVTTNLRTLIENDWLKDLQYLCEPTKYHKKRITVYFNAISLGITREFLRHRVFSFAQQSTRYCNYSKTNKFGEHLQFVKPYWCDALLGDYIENNGLITNCFEGTEFQDMSNTTMYLISSLIIAEDAYKSLLSEKCSPQQAREVLPLALNAPLVMTGFVEDWKHFFNLRCSFKAVTGKPHPDASVLADPLYEEFKKMKLI